MVGCVGNLYRSIQNISDVYIESAANKEALLKPKSPSCGASFPLLLPDSSPSKYKTYYECSVEGNHNNYSCCPNVADHPNDLSRRVMTQRVVFLETEHMNSWTSCSSGYVKEVVTYMAMDDLEVKLGGCIHYRFGSYVCDMQALKLLKTSLYSKNVLTDIFFGKN